MMNFLCFISAKLNYLACSGCDSGFGSGMNLLCDDCLRKITFFSDFCCKSCGGELDGVLGCCSKCLKEGERPFAEAASVFSYQQFGKEIILKYKSKGALPFARIFGRMAAERIRSNYSYWDFDIIVPVPLHWSRKFSRTYNQAELIADFLSKELAVDCFPNALRRIKRAKSQKFLSGKERHKNLRNAFRGNKKIVQGRKILLIDDVFTTGATLSCCADELLNCGAERIYALSIARA